MYLSTLAAVDIHPIPISILSSYPLAQRRTLCSTIVATTLSTPSLSLDTQAHVDWTLEIIGHSFQLPLDHPNDIAAVSGALCLYRNWLGLGPAPFPSDPTASASGNSSNTNTKNNHHHPAAASLSSATGHHSTHSTPSSDQEEQSSGLFGWRSSPRPKSGGSHRDTNVNTTHNPLNQMDKPTCPRGIELDRPHYMQEMVRHMSTLFRCRGSAVLLSQHVDLCLYALQIYRDLGSATHFFVATSTWEALMRVTLGIALHVMAPSSDAPQQWAGELGGTMITTVMDGKKVYAARTGTEHSLLS